MTFSNIFSIILPYLSSYIALLYLSSIKAFYILPISLQIMYILLLLSLDLSLFSCFLHYFGLYIRMWALFIHKEFFSFSGKQMKLGIILLQEISQIQKTNIAFWI